MNEKRSSFSGKLGFVLAAAGSAVGLGNIWRFPYLAAKYGGGIFLLVYILLAVTFGFALMTAEIGLGRRTGLSAIGAFKKLDKRFGFIGWIAALVPVIILPYYSVIGGWVAKYMATFASGNGIMAANDEFFVNFCASWQQGLGWFGLFIGITALVVFFEVDKGIEAVSKFMMPVLVLLSIGIAVYTLCQDGAMEGLKYYLIPNINNFKVETVLAAMGQLFYSMSLAMGIMITYGSYMKKETSIESSVSNIELFDTGIAFLAGLMIIPGISVMTGGVLNPSDLKKGPGLMFMVLPKVFDKMPGGQIVGALFFVMVFFAALTSSISLMETVISIVRDKFDLGRKLSASIVLLVSIILGTLSVLGNDVGVSVWSSIKILGFEFLGFFDFISNSVVMPIVALLTCIFIGYIVKPGFITEEVELNGRFKRKALFNVMIKYIAPILIVAILIFSVLEGLKIITI